MTHRDPGANVDNSAISRVEKWLDRGHYLIFGPILVLFFAFAVFGGSIFFGIGLCAPPRPTTRPATPPLPPPTRPPLRSPSSSPPSSHTALALDGSYAPITLINWACWLIGSALFQGILPRLTPRAAHPRTPSVPTPHTH